jgi:uncharacterized protein YyaL (SSP411 family)
MSALQSFGERGGWPLTMFLTPQGEPFWGGTYFPKVEQYGRPAFVTVLNTVAQAFKTEPERIAYNTKTVRENLGKAPDQEPGAALSLEILNNLATQFVNFVDQTDGGLRGSPKFPNSPVFEFLWRAGTRLGKVPYRDLVKLTLDRMSEGGIYDHLGGGYARYSTDERWLVPHFEKMLYDNAQILELLALCHHEFHDELFKTRASEVIGWLEREMIGPEGAFSASLDADSEGVEGKFYVWTWDQLVAVLGVADTTFLGKFYNASRIGNWAEEKHGLTVTILNRLEAKRPTEEEEARLAPLRQKLFDEREKRVHPGLDDKIMADWNGLMISAIINAATLLNEPDWIKIAARAYDFIVSTLQYQDSAGAKRLAHSWRAGVLVTPGMALDHAAMIRAALALHEVRNLAGLSGQLTRDYLGDAIGWAEAIETYHVDENSKLLCMAAKDAKDVILRLAPTADDAIPNAHPVFLSALIRLAGLSGDDRWLKRADALFEAVTPLVRKNYVSHSGILNALDLRLRVKEIVTAGPDRQSLYEQSLAIPFINRIVMDLDRPEALPQGHPARAQAAMAKEAAAFICSGSVCSLPVKDSQSLQTTVGVV